MANLHNYACSGCGKMCDRDSLTVKKALFTEMGKGASTVRARVVGWYCPSCTLNDEDWNRPAHVRPSDRPVEKKEANARTQTVL